MGILENLGMGDLFKTPQELLKEKERKLRRAISNIGRLSNSSRRSIDRKRAENSRLWEEARSAVSTGNKGGAQMALERFRTGQMDIRRQEMRMSVLQSWESRLNNMMDDMALAAAVGTINKDLSIYDPEKIIGQFQNMDMNLEDGGQMNDFWDDQYNKELNGSYGLSSQIPDVDSLMKNLQDEVAVDISGGRISTYPETTSPASEGISDVKDRMDQILNGDNK